MKNTFASFINILKCMKVSHRFIHISSITRTPTVDLAYKIYGEENLKGLCPIIVHHGLLGSKKNWESVSTNLASSTKRSVVAVDSRNHGQSPHVDSHTYGELALDVALLMGKLAISQAVFIGHSMGGRTGMVLALTQPTKVAGLVVVDISPVPSHVINEFLPSLLDAMKKVDFTGVKNVSEAKVVARKTLKASGDIGEGTLSFILMKIGKRPDKTIGWVYNVKALIENFPIIATFPSDMQGKTYKGPTLFIGGQESAFIPPSDLTGIKIYFPKADLKYIPGVGHNVHAENPTAFTNMVLDFLTTIKK